MLIKKLKQNFNFMHTTFCKYVSLLIRDGKLKINVRLLDFSMLRYSVTDPGILGGLGG